MKKQIVTIAALDMSLNMFAQQWPVPNQEA